MGISHDSHLHPHKNNNLGPEIIPLSNDSDSQKVYGNSLEEETSSLGSLDALILNIGVGISRTKVPIPHRVLTKEEI